MVVVRLQRRRQATYFAGEVTPPADLLSLPGGLVPTGWGGAARARAAQNSNIRSRGKSRLRPICYSLLCAFVIRSSCSNVHLPIGFWRPQSTAGGCSAGMKTCSALGAFNPPPPPAAPTPARPPPAAPPRARAACWHPLWRLTAVPAAVITLKTPQALPEGPGATKF